MEKILELERVIKPTNISQDTHKTMIISFIIKKNPIPFLKNIQFQVRFMWICGPPLVQHSRSGDFHLAWGTPPSPSEIPRKMKNN